MPKSKRASSAKKAKQKSLLNKTRDRQPKPQSAPHCPPKLGQHTPHNTKNNGQPKQIDCVPQHSQQSVAQPVLSSDNNIIKAHLAAGGPSMPSGAPLKAIHLPVNQSLLPTATPLATATIPANEPACNSHNTHKINSSKSQQLKVTTGLSELKQKPVLRYKHSLPNHAPHPYRQRIGQGQTQQTQTLQPPLLQPPWQIQGPQHPISSPCANTQQKVLAHGKHIVPDNSCQSDALCATSALGTAPNLMHYFQKQHLLHMQRSNQENFQDKTTHTQARRRAPKKAVKRLQPQRETVAVKKYTSIQPKRSLQTRNPATGNIHRTDPNVPVHPEFDQLITNIQTDILQAHERLKSMSSSMKRKPKTKTQVLNSENSSKSNAVEVYKQTTTSKNQQDMKSSRALTPERKKSMKEYIDRMRTSPDFRRAENKVRSDRYYSSKPNKDTQEMEELIKAFKEKTAIGPIHICISCDRLCYRQAVVSANRLLEMGRSKTELCAVGPVSAEGKKWICHTCNNYLRQDRVPPLALINGNKFPEKPAHLDLHQLEWRLLAPRLVFMKIHQAPRGKQLKIEGNVVNVIADVANTVHTLPRMRTNADTIPVKLKRNVKYKNHTLSQNVRPNKVRQAARWLTTNGPLFQQQGIVFNPKVLRRSKKKRKFVATKVKEASKYTGRRKTTYKCDFTACEYYTKDYACALSHLKHVHDAILHTAPKGHTSQNKLVFIKKQRPKRPNELGQTWCTICSRTIRPAQKPREHMREVHDMLSPSAGFAHYRQQPRSRLTTVWTYKQIKSQYIKRLRPTYLPKRCPAQSIMYPCKENRKLQAPKPLKRASKLTNKAIPKITSMPAEETQADPDVKTIQPVPTLPREADAESEDEAESAGATDTMLSQSNYIEGAERNKIYSYAPGAKERPKSIFLDKFCEELAYPDIFLGHQRPTERIVNVNYSDTVKSELLQTDRRAATNVENIFFKTKKIQMKLLTGRTQLALRQHKTSDMTITAGDLKDGSNIKKIIQHDQGYKFLSTLRGSPPYFEKAKRDIFAMIRQLGPATYFVSLSAAETHWNHLIRILGQTVDKKSYTEDEINKMTWTERSRLIQSDPVSCARHFDHTLRLFITEFLKSKHAPIGILEDFFYRVEMQHRGSCHVHMLVWIKQAPQLETSDESEITAFIDKHVSCAAAPLTEPSMMALVDRQRHHHTKTCRQKKNGQCRFKYPQPPMPSTVILEPIPADDENISTYKDHWKKIRAYLDMCDSKVLIPFSTFLQQLNLTYKEYENGVRAGLKAKTVFLKRQTNEVTINNYNKHCLKAWRANMDIQYIVDAYACATYIVSYMSKGCRGMSTLLRQACKEASEGNDNLKEQMRHIGNKFLNSVEISAQEAAYICLQMALRQSSRATVYISTSPPNERVRLLKSCHELEELDDNDTNIDSSNILTRYSNRPKNLEQTCLAEWAAWFDCRKPHTREASDKMDVDGTPIEHQNQLDEDNPEDVPLIDMADMDKPKSRRKLARILRCPWFNVTQHPEKHYRELIMLFVHWRQESVDLLAGYSSFYDHFLDKKDTILALLDQYSPGRAAVEDAITKMQTLEDEEYDNIAVAPHNQTEQANDEAEETITSDPNFVQQYDIGTDIGVNVQTLETMQGLCHNQIGDQEFREDARSLNPEQRAFFDFITKSIQTDCPQLFLFLSGGAGVGKTKTTNTIYQQLLRIYNRTAGEDFEQLQILVMAPTGKAAHLIHGSTIHSALSAPFNNITEDYFPLSTSTLNTARMKLGHVKFVIIDEISMVGNNVFNFINRRLQDIIGTDRPFGGCHVLCVGDLFQLRPVADRWIFLNSKLGKGPLTPNLWQNLFKMHELTQIMRQRDHYSFAELLNRLREGHQTDDDVEFLKSKVITSDFSTPNYPHTQVTHLFNKNEDVEAFNLVARKNQPIIIIAKDKMSGACSAGMEEAHLNNLRSKKTKHTQGLATSLTLALEDRIEIAVNIDVADGLTNGASGMIMGLPGTSATNRCHADGLIWVLFDEETVGRQARKKYINLYSTSTPRTWTPIAPVKKQINITKKSELYAIRIQFPIRCAAAKTIHRCQGQTLHSVVADFHASSGPHKHYVAISRVSDPNSLYITNLDTRFFRTDKGVAKEMVRLRTTHKAEIPAEMRYNEPSPDQHLVFFNISSMPKYVLDLGYDQIFKRSHVACILETHITPRTDLSIFAAMHPHQEHHKPSKYWAQGKAKHGISIYSKTPIHNTRFYTTNTLEAVVLDVAMPKLATVVAVYRYHRKPVLQFFKDLHTMLDGATQRIMYIGGDMNLDYSNKAVAFRIKTELQDHYNLQQIINEPTTKRGTIIDHIYTNDKAQGSMVFHPYYSDHHIVSCTLNRS